MHTWPQDDNATGIQMNESRVEKWQPVDQTQPAAYFNKECFIGTLPSSFIYSSSVAAFMLKQQSSVVMLTLMAHRAENFSYLVLYRKKICWSLPLNILSAKNRNMENI